jgi:PAS domain-containing protein
MNKLWKNIGIGAGITVIVCGGLLIMGSQRAVAVNSPDLEYAKLQTLAAAWESRVQSTYAEFQTEILRHNMARILDQPKQWSDWRVSTYFEKIRASWSGECGTPKTLALVSAGSAVLATSGDTSGLGRVLTSIGKNMTGFIVVGGEDHAALCLAIQYAPPTDRDLGIQPGRLIALFDPSSIFALIDSAPHSWMLLSDPKTTVLASTTMTPLSVINSLWPLLIQKKTGLLPQNDGSTLAFCTVHLSGSTSMLLASLITPRHATINPLWWLLIASAGLGLILLSNQHPSRCTQLPAQSISDSSDPAADTASNLAQRFSGELPLSPTVQAADHAAETELRALEVALKQAQENFNVLCSLAPAAVLLADPRDHIILNANAEASNLVGTTEGDLLGKSFDTLCDKPWDSGSDTGELWIKNRDNRSLLRDYACALIKLEGVPTLLIVLSRPGTQPTVACAIRADEDYLSEISDTSDASSQPPLGPAMIIAYDPTVRNATRRLLDKLGHENEAFSTLDDATIWLITRNTRPAFVAIDLSDYDEGLNWIEEMRFRCGSVVCLCLTDGESEEHVVESELNGNLTKPFDLESLASALDNLNLRLNDSPPLSENITPVQTSFGYA